VTNLVSRCSGAFCFEIEAGFQARNDAGEQVAHAGDVLDLRLHDVAAVADQQPDLKVELSDRLDLTQVGPDPDLLGDGACIARVGFVFAPDRTQPGTIDGGARDMDERELNFGQHGLGQTRDTAEDVQTNARRATQSGQFACDVSISVGVSNRLRSIRTVPSASMAVTQCISLAMSIPTLILMARPGR
jgi:hypothetical protein